MKYNRWMITLRIQDELGNDIFRTITHENKKCIINLLNWRDNYMESENLIACAILNVEKLPSRKR